VTLGLRPRLDLAALVPRAVGQFVLEPLGRGVPVVVVAARLCAEILGTDFALAGDDEPRH